MSRGLRSRLRRVLVSLPIVGEAVFSARDRLRHAQLLREGTFAQLDRWRPEIVCLEVMTAVGKASDDAVHHLESRGYRVLRDLGLNVVMERVSSDEHALRSPMPGD